MVTVHTLLHLLLLNFQQTVKGYSFLFISTTLRVEHKKSFI